ATAYPAAAMQAQIPMDCRKSSRAGTLRHTLVPWRYSADRRSLGFLFFLGVLFCVQWSGLARHWSLLLISCVFAFIACIIKHNHIHCRTFANRSWNRALEFLL